MTTSPWRRFTRAITLQAKRTYEAVGVFLGYHPSNPSLASLWQYGTSGASGVPVTQHTALGLATYFACVRCLSEDVAKLPFKTYERITSGREERAEHIAYRLLHSAPSEESTAIAFREAMTADALTMGNAYAEIVRQGSKPIALYKLDPTLVTPERDPAGRLVYRVVGADGRSETMQPDDIFHLHGLGPDSICGYSVLRYAIECLGLGLAQQKFGAAFYGNSASPSAIIELEESVDSDELERIKASWKTKFGGADKAGTPAFLIKGMKYHPYTINPVDQQLLESRQFSVEEICRWFRMPPHKVQHLLRSTNNNIEHQSIEYVIDTLLPWLVRWEQEANRKLLQPSERTRLYTEHNVEMLLRGDSQSQAMYFKELFYIGSITINEIRRLKNLPNIGPAGDLHYVPVNMQTVQQSQAVKVETIAQQKVNEMIEKLLSSASDQGLGDRSAELDRSASLVLSASIDRLVKREALAMGRAAKKPSSFLAELEEFLDRQTDFAAEVLRVPVQVAISLRDLPGSVDEVLASAVESYVAGAREKWLSAAECSPNDLPAEVVRVSNSRMTDATQTIEGGLTCSTLKC